MSSVTPHRNGSTLSSGNKSCRACLVVPKLLGARLNVFPCRQCRERACIPWSGSGPQFNFVPGVMISVRRDPAGQKRRPTTKSLPSAFVRFCRHMARRRPGRPNRHPRPAPVHTTSTRASREDAHRIIAQPHFSAPPFPSRRSNLCVRPDGDRQIPAISGILN